jgi:prevent-host-death family protein
LSAPTAPNGIEADGYGSSDGPLSSKGACGGGLEVTTSGRYIDVVETIGLRELNQNPSRAVARVRAGESLLVTDRGRPVLRMVPEVESPGVLSRMVAEGTATAPAEDGLPELMEDLAPEVDSVTDLLLAERARER